MTIEYFDPRFGDTYVVTMDGIPFRVTRVLRYVDRIGRDPIPYDRVEDLPARARTAVEQLIHEKCNPTSPQS